MTTPTQNKFKSTTVYGAFINDDYPDASVLASANFKRNITTTGDLLLNGGSTASTVSFVTTTTPIYGNINAIGNLNLTGATGSVVTKNSSGVTLSTTYNSYGGGLICKSITNNGTLNQLGGATFSGNIYGPTQLLTDSSNLLATTSFVKNQGYLSSVSTAYAPVTNPAAGANNYASITAIATTYQTIASMFSYLTTSSAAASYQAKTDMASYLTTALASTTYLTKTLAASTYITTSIAVGVFQSKGDMTNYAPLASPSFTGNVTAAGFVSTSVTPTSASHLCNKTYVDSVTSGSLNNQFSKAKILI